MVAGMTQKDISLWDIRRQGRILKIEQTLTIDCLEYDGQNYLLYNTADEVRVIDILNSYDMEGEGRITNDILEKYSNLHDSGDDSQR